MREIAMIHRVGLLAAAAAVLFAGSVRASTLKSIEGESVTLGGVTGMVYYTVEPAGYRVVATMQAGEDHTVVRFIATLTPEQSVTLSTPRGVGEPPIEVRFERHGQQVFVESGGLATAAPRVADAQ
jgi:hypothetical protein